MSINVQCDCCVRTWFAAEALAGRSVRCPECEGPMVVPADTVQPGPIEMHLPRGDQASPKNEPGTAVPDRTWRGRCRKGGLVTSPGFLSVVIAVVGLLAPLGLDWGQSKWASGK